MQASRISTLSDSASKFCSGACNFLKPRTARSPRQFAMCPRSQEKAGAERGAARAWAPWSVEYSDVEDCEGKVLLRLRRINPSGLPRIRRVFPPKCVSSKRQIIRNRSNINNHLSSFPNSVSSCCFDLHATRDKSWRSNTVSLASVR